MIKLKSIVSESVNESISDREFERDVTDIQSEVEQEWWNGQKHQSWRLVPARDLIVVWNTFAKYGRVDENKLDKIWDVIKECAIKIILNSDWWGHGIAELVGKEDEDEVTRQDYERFALFMSDRSGSNLWRGTGDAPGGMGRYSDVSRHIYQLLVKCYDAQTPEERLIAIDQLLNMIHGSGPMAKWFVEGGTTTLSKLRDFEVKGIHLTGKLSENFFKSFQAHRAGDSHYVEIFKNPSQREIKDAMSGDTELGMILLGKDTYVWDRGKALHVEAMKEIGNTTDMLPILVNIVGRDCTVYVTDAARHTKWYRQPETKKYILSHPFFKFKNVEDISYWDEDINGKWDGKSTEGDWYKDNQLNEAKNPRLGLCYELSGRYVSQHPKAVLVHGRLTNPFGKGHPELDHAWVEEGNEILDPVMDKRWPKEVYEGLFKAKVYKKYTYMEVLKIILKYQNWGPWDDIISEARVLGRPLPQTGYTEKYAIIYRAMIAKETKLYDNDYVTRSKQWAIEHSDHMTSVHSELYHVMRYIVDAKHVFESYNPGEYHYKGPDVRGKEVYASKDFL